MELRHEEPDIVLQWRNRIKVPPACCHTCDYYNDAGVCTKYGMEPPDDFAASVGTCPEWREEIPF